VPTIITGLPVEAVLRVVGILFVPSMAKCLAADRVREETGQRCLLKRYLTNEQCRLGERLQLD